MSPGPTRIDVIGQQSVTSFPLRLRPIFVPHALLIAVIVVASSVHALFELTEWLL
jgi:hypothetical protein